MELANGGTKRPARTQNAAGNAMNNLPLAVTKELQELQPQFQSLHRELETVCEQSLSLHSKSALIIISCRSKLNSVHILEKRSVFN